MCKIRTKAIVSILVALLMAMSSIPAVFAVLSPEEEESYHTPGGLFVNIKQDAPALETLFEGYAIELADLVKTLVSKSGYCVAAGGKDTEGEIIGYLYHIWLVDETKEMLEETVEMLLTSPYVYGAVVNSYSEETTPESSTNPVNTEKPSIPEIVVPINPVPSRPSDVKFHSGRVLVSMTKGTPSLERMLEGFEIESIRLLTPGSNTQTVYLVEFAEKTYEIVTQAIEVLSKNPDVIAEPDYIGEYSVELGGSYQPIDVPIKGDANGDSKLDVRDATDVQKYLAGFALSAEYSTFGIVADFDGDGKVTVKDATEIQKLIAGIV